MGRRSVLRQCCLALACLSLFPTPLLASSIHVASTGSGEVSEFQVTIASARIHHCAQDEEHICEISPPPSASSSTLSSTSLSMLNDEELLECLNSKYALCPEGVLEARIRVEHIEEVCSSAQVVAFDLSKVLVDLNQRFPKSQLKAGSVEEIVFPATTLGNLCSGEGVVRVKTANADAVGSDICSSSTGNDIVTNAHLNSTAAGATLAFEMRPRAFLRNFHKSVAARATYPCQFGTKTVRKQTSMTPQMASADVNESVTLILTAGRLMSKLDPPQRYTTTISPTDLPVNPGLTTLGAGNPEPQPSGSNPKIGNKQLLLTGVLGVLLLTGVLGV